MNVSNYVICRQLPFALAYAGLGDSETVNDLAGYRVTVTQIPN